MKKHVLTPLTWRGFYDVVFFAFRFDDDFLLSLLVIRRGLFETLRRSSDVVSIRRCHRPIRQTVSTPFPACITALLDVHHRNDFVAHLRVYLWRVLWWCGAAASRHTLPTTVARNSSAAATVGASTTSDVGIETAPIEKC